MMDIRKNTFAINSILFKLFDIELSSELAEEFLISLSDIEQNELNIYNQLNIQSIYIGIDKFKTFRGTALFDTVTNQIKEQAVDWVDLDNILFVYPSYKQNIFTFASVDIK